MLSIEPDSSPAQPGAGEAVRYCPVSPLKLGFMSVFTLGLYQIYWFYRTWRYVKDRDDSGIWPLARAVVAPLSYPLLLRDLKDEEARLQEGEAPLSAPSPLGPSMGYVLLNMFWVLPGLLSWVGLLSFLPLLPALRRVNALNSPESAAYVQNSRWGVRHALLALVVAPLLALGMAGDVGLLPPDAVQPGSELSDSAKGYLQETILRQGEDVHYFYFANPFDPSGGGSLLTEQGVVSYRTDPETGELVVERATPSSIRDLEVDYGFAVNPTIVTVERRNGTTIVLELSPADDGDRAFVEELGSRLPFGTPVRVR